MDTYLDIETTGLSPSRHKITVVGIAVGDNNSVVQLVGDGISRDRIMEVLRPATAIYTYNGTRFDIPFLAAQIGVDLRSFLHHGLMLDCWKRQLYGGLKVVENELGISRQLGYICGRDAVSLWKKYESSQDRESLSLLLEYNKEDVFSLRALRHILRPIPPLIHR